MSLCPPGLWRRPVEDLQLIQPASPFPATVSFLLLPDLTPGFRFVVFFQVFLSYTQAGSSFVFGETLVKDIFAFQVS